MQSNNGFTGHVGKPLGRSTHEQTRTQRKGQCFRKTAVFMHLVNMTGKIQVQSSNSPSLVCVGGAKKKNLHKHYHISIDVREFTGKPNAHSAIVMNRPTQVFLKKRGNSNN